MITALNKSIIDKLKVAIKSANMGKIAVTPQDLSEPITRPSVKVSLEDSTISRVNPNCISKEIQCKIYFYATNGDRPKLENTAMRELITDTFMDFLEINGVAIAIEEIEAVTSDGVLICSFSVIYSEQLSEPDAPPMEKLSFRSDT